MKKEIFIISFMLILFSLNSVWATIDSGTGKPGQTFTISQICEDATFITLSSIQYPNRSTEIINTNMSSVGGGSFQYNFTTTNDIGRYDYCGISDGCGKSFCSYFEITNSGIILSNAESILYLGLIIINLLLFSFFLYWTIKLPYSNKVDKDGTITRITKSKYLKLLCALLTYGSFIWFFGMFTGIVNNFISLDISRTMISALYILFYGLGIGFTLLIFIILFIEIWKDILLWEQIKKFGRAHVNR